jgi:hypothetical protein
MLYLEICNVRNTVNERKVLEGSFNQAVNESDMALPAALHPILPSGSNVEVNKLHHGSRSWQVLVGEILFVHVQIRLRIDFEQHHFARPRIDHGTVAG